MTRPCYIDCIELSESFYHSLSVDFWWITRLIALIHPTWLNREIATLPHAETTLSRNDREFGGLRLQPTLHYSTQRFQLR